MIIIAFKLGRRVLDNIKMTEERFNRRKTLKITGLLVASLLAGDITSDVLNRKFLSYSQPDYIFKPKNDEISHVNYKSYKDRVEENINNF